MQGHHLTADALAGDEGDECPGQHQAAGPASRHAPPLPLHNSIAPPPGMDTRCCPPHPPLGGGGRRGSMEPQNLTNDPPQDALADGGARPALRTTATTNSSRKHQNVTGSRQLLGTAREQVST